ncbi:MAG: B12-binding domain-containing radical SAM protein, partial [Kiritimatiellia bacterium]|nr:B12-binding domain-containing radical SAM protein [Kiritimatiellia bacterium]
ETIRETSAFLKKLRPGTATFGILTPYPGTEIFDTVAEIYPDIRDGSGSTMENLHTEGFYSDALCSIGGAQLSQEVVGAYRQFYLRPGYLVERLSRIRSLEELTMRVIGGYSVLQFAVTGKK